jgi:adenosylcobinamide-phosphate guanylyltransferase
MCGGAGTRLDRGEKPLFEVGGEPMVDRVRRALEVSRVDAIHAVTSPKAPKTAAHLEGRVPTIETDGEGYVTDLGVALEHVDRPVLTVVSDLPLLAGEVVDRVLDAYGDEYDEGQRGSLTVSVPTALKDALGVSADTTTAHGGHERSPCGLNVVGEDSTEALHVSYDARLAVNVNRPADAEVAEVLAGGP